MSQEQNYAETTCDKVTRFLKDWQRGNRFKNFFYGDPGGIPLDETPAVIVDLQSTKIEQGPTGTDLISEDILIKVVINKLTFMDDFNDDTVSWKKMLELMVQGNDPITGTYDPTTLVGVLRSNFTLDNYALDQNMDIQYGLVPRNGIEEEPTGEAHITLNIDHHQLSSKS